MSRGGDLLVLGERAWTTYSVHQDMEKVRSDQVKSHSTLCIHMPVQRSWTINSVTSHSVNDNISRFGFSIIVTALSSKHALPFNSIYQHHHIY